MNSQIRWKQRLQSLEKAFHNFSAFMIKGDLNDLELQGLVKAFEYTFELAWNTLKDFYEYQGDEGIQGSRDAITLAYERGLIKDGEGWMQMLKSRNLTSHIYNEEKMREITEQIVKSYYDLIKDLITELKSL